MGEDILIGRTRLGEAEPAAANPLAGKRGAAAGPGGDVSLHLPLANRHGLVTGATGTGKTVTLQVLAEGFSAAGVPVFAADVKGDLSGLAAMGGAKPAFTERAAKLGLPYEPARFPVTFWDLFGEQGHPIRATVTEMGPLLLARLLELNDVQEGVLNIVFRVADDEGLLLLDLKDLRALLNHVAEEAANLAAKYGNVTKASVGAIQRALLVLENQGAERFFGEPALAIQDFMRPAPDGRGMINILAADKLMAKPRLYGTFLLWMLSELFEELPEAGDLAQPKLVFFFDEAHLLFNDAPRALLDAIEGVVRLIRSKGVGVYFVTQNPVDVPDTVLAQLGNRVQHALRAFTPRDQRAVRAAAETFRQNPALGDLSAAITQLGVGEALVSPLEKGGVPGIVQRTFVRPPSARVGPITAEERAAIVAASPMRGKYEKAVNRESAYEKLTGKIAAGTGETAEPASDGGIFGKIKDVVGSVLTGKPIAKGGRQTQSALEQAIRTATRTFVQGVARQAGNEIRKAIVRRITGSSSGKGMGFIGSPGAGGRSSFLDLPSQATLVSIAAEAVQTRNPLQPHRD